MMGLAYTMVELMVMDKKITGSFHKNITREHVTFVSVVEKLVSCLCKKLNCKVSVDNVSHI